MTTDQQAQSFAIALHDLVEKQIKETGLAPQPAAAVMAHAAKKALEHLAWMPQETQLSYEHLTKAAGFLGGFYSEPLVVTIKEA